MTKGDYTRPVDEIVTIGNDDRHDTAGIVQCLAINSTGADYYSSSRTQANAERPELASVLDASEPYRIRPEDHEPGCDAGRHRPRIGPRCLMILRQRLERLWETEFTRGLVGQREFIGQRPAAYQPPS